MHFAGSWRVRWRAVVGSTSADGISAASMLWAMSLIVLPVGTAITITVGAIGGCRAR